MLFSLDAAYDRTACRRTRLLFPWNSAAHEPRCDLTEAAAIIPPDGMRHYCLVYTTARQNVRQYQYLEGSRRWGAHLTLDGYCAALTDRRRTTARSPCAKRGSFPHHQVARIPLRPPPLHWRRRARVVRCDVRRYHLECIPALLQARINGDGLSPARVQLGHQNEQHGLHTITSIALTVREPASSLPQSLTYAAAIRCQASYEMEKTPVSDRPIDRCFRVAYDTPSSTHPKE